MRKEVLDLLQVAENEDYVDGTLGLGGHAWEILEKSSPEGRLLGIDRDRESLEKAGERLNHLSRVFLRHGSYDQTPAFLEELGWGQVHGMLLDLGVSSFQLLHPERGFSFLIDSALDMRMDLEEKVTARELLNNLPEPRLEAIFREYGEERFAKRIARSIVYSRREAPIGTTGELCKIVSRAVPFSKSRIHPATRVFQALRIAVNRELEILKTFLEKSPDFIKVGGVLAILSFHSLEDRIVKMAFRSYKNFKILTKKPLTPSREEILQNPRSRSAKLRAIRRVE
jgi:16S rRNA (cytosine1402-N4)-methyltransferase